MGINELQQGVNNMITSGKPKQMELFEEDIHEQLAMNYIHSTSKTIPEDPVHRPKHYMLFEDKNIEVRDVIKKLVYKIENSTKQYDSMFCADYVQMMQYLMRFMDKNGLEDLKKASVYLNWMLEDRDAQ